MEREKGRSNRRQDCIGLRAQNDREMYAHSPSQFQVRASVPP